MRWQHPNTKKLFIRASDKLVKLRHRNANEHMSQVVHIPAYKAQEMRTDNPLCWCRIDILFKSSSAVELPEYIAEYLLSVFPKVIFRVEPVVFHYDKLEWNDLKALAQELKVFKVGMNKKSVINAIKEARNDISTSS